MPTAGKLPVAGEILAYLAEHPGAQDTVEGIVEWWLLEQEIKHHTTQVKEALAELVTKGLVLKHKGRDARIYYRMNQHKTEEIRALLRSSEIWRG
jgi:predicted transcriptional regulator